MKVWTNIFLLIATIVALLGFSDSAGFAARPAQFLAVVFFNIAFFLGIADRWRSG